MKNMKFNKSININDLLVYSTNESLFYKKISDEEFKMINLNNIEDFFYVEFLDILFIYVNRSLVLYKYIDNEFKEIKRIDNILTHIDKTVFLNFNLLNIPFTIYMFDKSNLAFKTINKKFMFNFYDLYLNDEFMIPIIGAYDIKEMRLKKLILNFSSDGALIYRPYRREYLKELLSLIGEKYLSKEIEYVGFKKKHSTFEDSLQNKTFDFFNLNDGIVLFDKKLSLFDEDLNKEKTFIFYSNSKSYRLCFKFNKELFLNSSVNFFNPAIDESGIYIKIYLLGELKDKYSNICYHFDLDGNIKHIFYLSNKNLYLKVYSNLKEEYYADSISSLVKLTNEEIEVKTSKCNKDSFNLSKEFYSKAIKVTKEINEVNIKEISSLINEFNSFINDKKEYYSIGYFKEASSNPFSLFGAPELHIKN